MPTGPIPLILIGDPPLVADPGLQTVLLLHLHMCCLLFVFHARYSSSCSLYCLFCVHERRCGSGEAIPRDSTFSTWPMSCRPSATSWRGTTATSSTWVRAVALIFFSSVERHRLEIATRCCVNVVVSLCSGRWLSAFPLVIASHTDVRVFFARRVESFLSFPR